MNTHVLISVSFVFCSLSVGSLTQVKRDCAQCHCSFLVAEWSARPFSSQEVVRSNPTESGGERYFFVPGHKGTFLSLGVQKCSLRGTDKKVQKCTNVKGTVLYPDKVLLVRQSICTF